MARLPRLHVPCGFYHVMLRANHREDLFATPTDRWIREKPFILFFSAIFASLTYMDVGNAGVAWSDHRPRDTSFFSFPARQPAPAAIHRTSKTPTA
jgi:hypothetical protein